MKLLNQKKTSQCFSSFRRRQVNVSHHFQLLPMHCFCMEGLIRRRQVNVSHHFQLLPMHCFCMEGLIRRRQVNVSHHFQLLLMHCFCMEGLICFPILYVKIYIFLNVLFLLVNVLFRPVWPPVQFYHGLFMKINKP